MLIINLEPVAPNDNQKRKTWQSDRADINRFKAFVQENQDKFIVKSTANVELE